MSIGKSNFQLSGDSASRPELNGPAHTSRALKGLARRKREQRRNKDRRSLLESLEQRHLMAGPQLVGIQPNDNSLLVDGSVLNSAPRELVFRFDDNTAIDPATLSGIQITRAGDDQVFESARATSDVGTGGAALVEFRARQAGTAGEGVEVRFTSSSRQGSGGPLVTVAGRVVTIDFNSNPLSQPTTVRGLMSAIENNAAANALLQVFSVSGSTSTPISTAAITGTSVILRGANSADAVSDLGTNNAVRVRFISTIPGAAGRGTQVILQRADAGGPANPLVLVSGNQVTVRINSNAGNETTVAQLLTAINSNPDAARIVTAVQETGSAATVIGNRIGFAQTLLLTGASDILVEPGYVGIGNLPNEVVFRFAETLPDDTYQIDIFGTGALALTNADGEAFNDGNNASRRFSLNLGPQVLAVVPEPIRRTSTGLSPEIGVIEVHFDSDALDMSTAQDARYYQLVFTADTVTPADDVIVYPTSTGRIDGVSMVSYDRSTNIARLTFPGPLSRLPNGSGGFLTGAARLRVGATQSLPSAPTSLGQIAEPGDSAGTSFSLGDLTSIDVSGTRSVRLQSVIQNATEYGLQFPGADAAGIRIIRPEDAGRLDRTVPLDFFRQGPDSVNGITTFTYDFPSTFRGDDPNSPGIDTKKSYFNLISPEQRQRVREVLSLFSEYLGVQFVEAPAGASAGAFFSIAVGDLYGADEGATSEPGGLALATRDRDLDNRDDLVVLDFQDFEQSNDDQFGGEFFRGAMFAIGQVLGYGYADGLPQPVTQSTAFVFNPSTDNEPAYPSVADIINGQYLYRPDSIDVDLYRFTLQNAAQVSISTFAERLSNASLLDTQLRLYRQDAATGAFVEIAQNDDYFSNDSLLELDLTAGTYLIGVSASGNNTYDPVIGGTGFGGRSEGSYELRITTKLEATRGIRDESGVLLDGDADGHPGGVYDFWFVPSDQSNTLYVDKTATTTGTGTIAQPFRNLSSAVAQATPGTTIRVVANGGVDGKLETPGDNFSYQIGFANNGTALADGTSLDVPRGVRLVIDAGAVFKMRSSRIGVGSTAPLVNRSDAAIQVLGTPRIIGSDGLVARDSFGEVIPGSVYFTSFNDSSLGRGSSTATTPSPQAGDWGGIDLRGDLDAADTSRRNRENEGVFLNQIQFADMRYGGGQVSIDGRAVVVSPIDMAITRATIVNSKISLSADAAISATPDTFTETRFDEAIFQQNGAFIPTVMRVGPEIHGNTIVDNTINGMFVRVTTRSGAVLQPLTTQARFDDTDVVHVLTENLTIQGTPGGPVSPAQAPSSLVIASQALVGGGQVAPGTYTYRLSYASATTESAASGNTVPVTVSTLGVVSLTQLPAVPNGSGFTQRRLYRATVAADGTVGEFFKVADLNATDSTYVDRAATGTTPLPAVANRLVARTDARLKIDPGTIVKTGGARVDVTFGADLIAEGTAADRIVFTSLKDPRFGAGGTFNTNSDDDGVSLAAGDWGGIYVGPSASASFDRITLAGAGGSSRIEGGFASFNPIEVHQGELRLTNSRLESNADGRGFSDPQNPDRIGRGTNASASVFVRGAQPIIVGNDVLNSTGPAISFDVNSLIFNEVTDAGRSTGRIEAVPSRGNSGPLVQGNRLFKNSINGMEVRGGQVATEVVFDDTDMVHVVRDTIEVPNQHIYGGLRLESDARGSLVVKFESSATSVAGIVAGGSLATAADQFVDIADRIGGSLQIVGHPDFPVVMTSLDDDFSGAGFTPFGLPQVDTNNNGIVVDEDDDQTGGGLVQLPTGPEVDNGTRIDDDVDPATPGFFEATITDGNQIGASGVTVQAQTGILINQDYVFQYSTYIRVGTTTTQLAQTTITQPATLVSDDRVESRGTFTGPNGLVNWIATSFFLDGTPTVFSQLDLSTSTGSLGAIQVISYLDEDVNAPSDDILYTVGTPGQADFRLFTVDTPLRIGFSHGGFYEDGPGQSNATYAGWAADRFNQLQTAITASTQTFSLPGVINQANLPLGNDPVFGSVYGPADVTTAHAWDVVPTAATSRITSFLELLSEDPSQAAPPQQVLSGQWNGVVIREGASDRNVLGTSEREPDNGVTTDSNAIPSQSQFLGELAADAQSGDENRRLGFIVDGVITRPGDVDVYSFLGQPGSQVWLDIDRTDLGLDTVVELIGANGETFALSDNSLEESRGDYLPLVSGGFEQTSARPLNTIPIAAGLPQSAYQDQFTSNPRDAGIRVVLPASAPSVGDSLLYHVRVRSSSVAPGGNRNELLTNLSGLTSGAYRLQIRLQEGDEVAGSQVRYADVRYATKGIQVIGQPLHNPLIADEYETAAPNETLQTAQPLGLFEVNIDGSVISSAGPLASDRLAKSVGGILSGATDVDWFSFDVNYQNLTRDDAALYLSTVFDIDYADGFARSDIAIYVFNGAGELILVGGDSNIADDQPTGQNGTNSNDLSRGSGGTLDPFIGAAELAEGNYFVAVVNQSQIPSVLNQFNTAAALNPLLRLEPVDSVTRIAEDRIDSVGGGTATPPTVPLLFNGEASTIPYTLNDVILYRLNGASVGLANPFTGVDYGSVGAVGGGFRDFSFMPNGELFAYSTPNTQVNADLDLAYSYFRINSENGTLTNLGVTGIETYHVVDPPPILVGGVVVDPPPLVVDSNDGLTIEGMTIANNSLGYFVGNRPIDYSAAGNGLQNAYYQNIIYAFNPRTGQATGLGAPNRQIRANGADDRANGAGTQIRERGYIETGNGVGQPATGNILVVPDATRVSPTGTATTLIDDGDSFVLQAGGQQFTIELDSGPVLNFSTNPAAGEFPIDGIVFSLTTASGTQVYELDSGPVITLDASQVIDGATVTVQDSAGQTRVFEFNSNAALINPNAISVDFVPLATTPAPTPAQIAQASAQLAQSLATAISGADFVANGFATPGQGRVDLTGDSTTVPPSVAGAGLAVTGAAGSADPNIPGSNIIRVRENFTAAELASAVAAATGGAVAGNRVNFRNVTSTNVTNLTVRNLVTQVGTAGVTTGSTGVRFLVSDTAEAIAIRVAQVVNSTTSMQAAGITATTNQNSVSFTNAVLNASNGSVDPSFSVGGVPPGGLIRGVATLGGALYAVSDAGGLYVVANPTAAVEGQIGTYVATATDLIGLNFSGLSAGPQNVEGGRFANLLFGVTDEGDVYAFDAAGRLQPVFAGGATSVNVGAGTRGIDFSTLDFNLWHVSESRGSDPGHGINAIHNGTRTSTPGGASYYFGAETTDEDIIANANTSPFAVPRQDGQGVRNTYNFPGGAKGAIESNEFNLKGYSAGDLPTLYFNYFLATDGVDSVTPGISDQDAFRVYAITEDGVEHLLTTNNVATGPLAEFDDEFDDPTLSGNPLLADLYADTIDVEVQPTFDSTNSWRQARVSLAEFAGQANMRLRIEFSTGASYGDGTLGIRAIAGNALVDGQTIEVGGRTFEIDLGTTLSIPSGAQIASFYAQSGSSPSNRVTAVVGGVTYVLNDGARTVNAGEVNVPLQVPGDQPLSTFTAQAVASRLATAIQTNGVPTTTVPFSFVAEPNDELLSATPLPNVSGNVVISGDGTLESGVDVDLYRIDVPANSTLEVSMAPAAGNTFIGNVRLFDSSGNPLAVGTSGSPAQFTSQSAQTIYIGLSSNSNSDYNPLVAGSGTPGVAGDYTASVSLTSDFRVIQNGSQLQITGGFSASGGPDGLVTATGTPGTEGIPVVVDASMTAAEIAVELQRAIARQFSGGITTAYPVFNSTITLPGLAVTDVGPFGLEGIRSSDFFGSTGVARAVDNNFEGIYIDDFIIGFAERGELVTGAVNDSSFTADSSPNFTNPAQPVSATVTGSYQLEIRDASEYVNSALGTTFRTFDTNDRLTKGLSVQTMPAANIVDGATFQISDGVSTVTFEFDVELTPGVGTGVAPGNVRVGIPAGGTLPAGDDGSVAVANAILAAVNDPSVRSLIDVTAVAADGVDSFGNGKINLFGPISISGAAGVFASVVQTGQRGDSNRDRAAQGTIIIENSRFLFNSDVGIELVHDAVADVAGQSTNAVVGYPANLVELNTERLIPGVVVQSNVIGFNENAGIRISGLANGGSLANPVPFERIVNNTIIGGLITPATTPIPGTFQGTLFSGGAISFADTVTSFTAGTGVATTFANPARATGAPDSTASGSEPVDGLTTVSLGAGGVLTVQFTDNLLTGSGDARPDLMIFETGEIESVRVAVSRDGVTFINVGVIGGIDRTIDLDAAGFGPQDRFAFVRLTDLRQGSLTSGSVGADIDAIGALSTVPVEQYTAGGEGISVINNASPTVLNNVIANTTTGLAVDATSLTTVVGANSYYRNTAATSGTPALPIGQFGEIIPSTVELFVDPLNLVFAPRAGVSIIDSSIDSLEDRSSLAIVRNAIGLPPSPIIAPRLDNNGQFRVDDPTVESPLGSGERIFKDRGAEDRADQVGPRAVLLSPRAEELGLSSGQAETRGTVFDSFDIQLVDGIGPVDPTPGVGIDDESVTSNTVLLSKDGVPLIEGVDYRFGYDASNNTIRLTPIAGIWEDNSTYTIRLLDSSDAVLRFGSGTARVDGSITTLLTSTGVFRDFELESGIRINITPAAVPAGIDGQIITIFDGSFALSFEVDTNAISSPTNIPVTVLATATADQIAVALADAINATALNLTATATGSLVQLLGPSSLTTATPSAQATTIYNITGAIGTRTGFGIGIPATGAAVSPTVTDGQTFTISRGGTLVRTFELDFGNGILTPGAIAVNVGASPTLDQIANAIVNAVGGAGLGLAPVNVGEGRVFLGGDANYSLDVTNSGLVQLGAAGQAPSVPVVVPIDATVEEVVAAYAAAIEGAGLQGVTTSSVGDRLILDGVEAVSGANAVTLPIIRDEVGNQLQSNGPSGQTILTVFVGGGFDYGDAPAPYTSSMNAGGPRHGVDHNLTLGQSITPDADAILPDGDSDDGVALVGTAASGFPATFTIEVNSADNRPFYVDAWIDWNRNGVFENSEVTRFRSPNATGAGLPVLGSGINTVSINVPSTVTNGLTYARVRLSEISGLGPNGDAPSGEVEDLAILVQSNPYQNPINPADVNKSGAVTALDALNVINLLSTYNRLRNPSAPAGNIPLNPPPAFMTDIVNGRYLPDVDGNGIVTANDALRVINFLSDAKRASLRSGEGEAFVPVADGVLASPLTIATSLTESDVEVNSESDAEALAGAPIAIATAKASSVTPTSVFDSPQIVALDEILDDLAADDREFAVHDAAAVDSVFSGLGLGL